MTSPSINGVPGARRMSLNSLALMGAEGQLRYYYTGSALVHFLVHFRHFNTHLFACATAILLGTIVPKIINGNLNVHPES